MWGGKSIENEHIAVFWERRAEFLHLFRSGFDLVQETNNHEALTLFTNANAQV